MFGALDISTSGLVAQRTRLDTVAANVANANTITQDGVTNSPFRRRIAILTTGDGRGNSGGVHVKRIELDDSPFVARIMPNHPMADENGVVWHPNIEPINEQINAIDASRAYEANITAAEATKRMIANSLTLLS